MSHILKRQELTLQTTSQYCHIFSERNFDGACYKLFTDTDSIVGNQLPAPCDGTLILLFGFFLSGHGREIFVNKIFCLFVCFLR